MTEEQKKTSKASKAIYRVLNSADGQLMMEYLKEHIGFSRPIFDPSGENVNQALLRDGGRQLIITIEKLYKHGANTNPTIDTDDD